MCSDTNSQKAILMEKQSSPFLCLFSDKLKVRFLFAMEKRKKKSLYTPSAKCPWDMTSPGLITGNGSISVEWCKWWQIPSSLIMRVQLIGVTHRDGHVLALGWGGELPDWIIQKWPVIGLSGRSAFSSGWGLRSLAFRGSAHLSLLQCVWWLKHYSHLSQGERVNSIQVLHMSVSGNRLCFWYICC